MNCWEYPSPPQQPSWAAYCCNQPIEFLPQIKICQQQGGIPEQLKGFQAGFGNDLQNSLNGFMPMIGLIALCSAFIMRR